VRSVIRCSSVIGDDRAAPPEVRLNYLGRYGDGGAGGDRQTPPGLSPLSGGRGDTMPVGYPLVVDVLAVDLGGRPELHASWEWPSALFAGKEVTARAELWFGPARHRRRGRPARSARDDGGAEAGRQPPVTRDRRPATTGD
jgi:hypothetical protein